MSITIFAVLPLVLLGLVALLGFVGCGLPTSGVGIPDPYQSTIKNSGPVAYWPLNEAAGAATAKDVTGNGHDGAYTNGGVMPGQAGIVPGDTINLLLQMSASFTGGHVEVPHKPALSPSSFTLEAWVLPDAGANPAIRTVVAHEVPPSSIGFALFADTNNNWTARVGDQSVYFAAAGPKDTVDISKPTFLVVTYDGTNLTLWVNPADTTQPPYAQTPASGFTAVPDPVAFFIGIGHPDLPPSLPFNGRIQDVALYDKVLSNATIQDHFNAGRGG